MILRQLPCYVCPFKGEIIFIVAYAVESNAAGIPYLIARLLSCQSILMVVDLGSFVPINAGGCAAGQGSGCS